MNWVSKIQEAIDYIEAHLLEDISVEDIGDSIHYAPPSFQHLFSAITGYSVMEYVRFRRLSCAADDMAEGRENVTELAYKYGYDTVEAFSKAFKRLFGCPPSRFSGPVRFAPLSVQFRLSGGFCMRKNFIPGLARVDWSDKERQNEFVNSVVSALNAVGGRWSYDYVCAVSGSSFRTSFSMPSSEPWNHGNYHVIHTPPIIGHTFRMLGYRMVQHVRGDYERDRAMIMESIDRGMPVITLEGVINCSDACVISGYDQDGEVLLGYNPFMHVEEDHKEAPDDTGYFRKSGWHDGFFAEGSIGRILLIQGTEARPSREEIFAETMALAKRLILEENLAPGQSNGLVAHKSFAHALMNYEWNDPFEPYLNVMCNYKQYLDRQYAVPFFREYGREDLADCYAKIAELARRMGQAIPQDFSAGHLFERREALKPYCQLLLDIAELEERAAELM